MNGCFTIGFFLLGVLMLFVSPLIGVLFILGACMAAAAEEKRVQTTYVAPEWKRTINFGPNGPPWAAEEEPLTLGGRVVFCGSIAELLEYGPKPPDIETSRGGSKAVEGSAQPPELWLTLHSGDQIKVPEPEANRLREWFDRLRVQREAF